MNLRQEQNMSAKEFADKIKEKLIDLSDNIQTNYDQQEFIESFKSEHEKIAIRTYKENILPPLKNRTDFCSSNPVYELYN